MYRVALGNSHIYEYSEAALKQNINDILFNSSYCCVTYINENGYGIESIEKKESILYTYQVSNLPETDVLRDLYKKYIIGERKKSASEIVGVTFFTGKEFTDITEPVYFEKDVPKEIRGNTAKILKWLKTTVANGLVKYRPNMYRYSSFVAIKVKVGISVSAEWWIRDPFNVEFRVESTQGYDDVTEVLLKTWLTVIGHEKVN